MPEIPAWHGGLPGSIMDADCILENTTAGTFLILLALVASACSGSPTAAPPVTVPKVQVIATTSILADFARNVGGTQVEVHSLIPPGTDVHSFRTTPQDSVAVGRAALIISNGFGLDDFLDPTLEAAKSTRAVHIVAAEGLQASPIEKLDPVERENARDIVIEEADPHFWQNPLYAVHYVERIRDSLIRVDPTHSQVYQDNATSYVQLLRDLDREIIQTLSGVPSERRHLITFHDAFRHFAERYGWKVSAFVPDDASDVTPRAMVKILERIREDGVPAIFSEPQFGAAVLGRAAEDAGVRVGTIYSDTVGAEVSSYIDMMRYNATSLLENLRKPLNPPFQKGGQGEFR